MSKTHTDKIEPVQRKKINSFVLSCFPTFLKSFFFFLRVILNLKVIKYEEDFREKCQKFKEAYSKQLQICRKKLRITLSYTAALFSGEGFLNKRFVRKKKTKATTNQFL